ncbi:RidA family protein [Kineosporia sp. NBRC 101731]|uniref:RidA family protein n=1 Tax=Kineosporia sp. NBRC 101731 TaxID=3032199 RepID=UPI0024A29493|nr:RidA family protein [Kineosporia sp. NBRC 101731]GLY30415.1 hypothetical protein Kisp02_37800 [Kineosporia sp. NBRC 101731]
MLSGQVAVDADGGVIAPGDVSAQTTVILEQIRDLLAAHGATLENVVHLRTFILDLGRLREYGAARTAFFAGLIPPASTTVGVSALFLPGVELEVEVLAGV